MKNCIVFISLIFLLISLIQVTPKATENSTDCINEELGVCYDGNECHLDDGIVGICNGCTCVPINS